MATRRKKKKKKSANPVWIWSGMSGGILVLLCVALYFKMQPGPSDRPTSATSESKLAKVELPKDLPTLATVEGGQGSIGDLFRTVAEVQTLMNSGGFDKEKALAAEKVIASLKSAAKTKMAKELLDKRIPKKRFDSPEVKKDLQALTKAVSTYVDIQLKDFKFAPAREAAFAQSLLGKQIFESNTRLKTRQSGLSIMRGGLNNLARIERAAFDDGEITQDELTKRNEKVMAWNDAVKAIEDNWNAKLKSIETRSKEQGLPNTADLKRVALKDEDPTFRRFAALRIGFAVYERGDPGNQEFLAEAIEELKASPDKAVAEAAKEGASVKREEYYELRK